jgi:hypothetical protein
MLRATAASTWAGTRVNTSSGRRAAASGNALNNAAGAEKWHRHVTIDGNGNNAEHAKHAEEASIYPISAQIDQQPLSFDGILGSKSY